MTKRAQARIDRIMGDAFTRAADVLEMEVRKLLDARPDLYSRFVLAVGWGPTLFDNDDKIVEPHLQSHAHRCCARARRMMAYANKFYDDFGADNRVVVATRETPTRGALS